MTYTIIIRGPLGVGKSTIAKILKEKLSADHYQMDSVIEENNLDDEGEDGFIKEDNLLKANEILIPKIEETLKSKIVIIDGCFYRKSQLDHLVNNIAHEVIVFTLKASLDSCKHRDKHRDYSYGEDAAFVVYNITTKFDYGIIIDTENQSVEDTIEEIVSYLPTIHS